MATWAPKKGQTTQQAQADSKKSPIYRQGTGFATGQAQSQQSPYSGSTPYQKNPAGDFAAYSPQTSTQRFGNTTLNQSITPGSSPYGQPPQMPTGQTDGNLANFPSMNRPAGFTASYGQPDGSFAESPNYNQRDAFVQALNDQQSPYMTGQARGMPQFDVNAARSRASEMTQQGFQNPFAQNSPAPLQAMESQSFPSQYQGPQASQPSRLLLPQNPSQQAGGLADIQRRLSNATTQEQIFEINRDGRGMMQQQSAPAGNRPPTQASGIRARGPGDPPDIAAPRTRYQRERDIVIQQQGGRSMTAGRANSESEQRLADALNSGLRKSGQLEQARVAMNAERGRNAGQIPTRFSPNAGQMVAGRVQSTGATGGGFGSGQGGPNPGAIGYRTNSVMNPPDPVMAGQLAPAAGNQRAQSQEDVIRQFQQQRGFDPREMMKRGGRGDRSPIYI